MKHLIFILFPLICQAQHVVVLGTAQDGGFPHIGCQAHCQLAHKDPTLARYVVSLALVDSVAKQWWLVEATPHMDKQLQYFQELTNGRYPYLPSGIFITHAHIGHYTGLMFLGREALGAKEVPVYALPKMIDFLQTQGPWSQLIGLGNIRPLAMQENVPLQLNERIHVAAMAVPHRDEFSETAAFTIGTSQRSYLFIPDIDKWSKWDKDIIQLVKSVDYAFLDATFFQEGELPNRPMAEVPHPFVAETMALFSNEEAGIRSRIHFIHFNHTNPILFDENTRKSIRDRGFNMADQGNTYR